VISEDVPQALHGQRLDRVVALLAAISRSDATLLVERGGVSVDGRTATSGKVRLDEGQHVDIDVSTLPGVQLPLPDRSIELTVRYEDDDVIVIDKPVGLVVHPGAGHPDGTLVNALLARYGEIAVVGDAMRPGIVHRLDAGTSGLLVVARSETAYEALVQALSAREVHRRYVALVWGHLAQRAGTIDAPLGRDPRDPLRRAVVVSGKPARTHYRVLQEFREPTDLALVSCELETGRTHQIRVHLAAIGHPVVGDATYGGDKPTLAAPRPMLHAAELAFAHPVTGDEIRVVSDVPEDFQIMLNQAMGQRPEPSERRPRA
jgi:23S rRNA pseudouridine1911/1915/1917 synthase